MNQIYFWIVAVIFCILIQYIIFGWVLWLKSNRPYLTENTLQWRENRVKTYIGKIAMLLLAVMLAWFTAHTYEDIPNKAEYLDKKQARVHIGVRTQNDFWGMGAFELIIAVLCGFSIYYNFDNSKDFIFLIVCLIFVLFSSVLVISRSIWNINQLANAAWCKTCREYSVEDWIYHPSTNQQTAEVEKRCKGCAPEVPDAQTDMMYSLIKAVATPKKQKTKKRVPAYTY